MQSPLVRLAIVIVSAWLVAVPAALLPGTTANDTPFSSASAALFAAGIPGRALAFALFPMLAGILTVVLTWRKPQPLRITLTMVLTMSAILFLVALLPWP